MMANEDVFMESGKHALHMKREYEVSYAGKKKQTVLSQLITGGST